MFKLLNKRNIKYMIRYTIDSYTVNKELGEVTGMVTFTDHLDVQSSSQPFKVESLDQNVIHTQLVASAMKFNNDNIAAADAAGLPDTIPGVEEGVEVHFDNNDTNNNSMITGIVFEDADNNGIRDDVNRMTDVLVDLLVAADDSVVASTTTNANGVYTFNNVSNGAYKVQFHIADGYEFSPQNQGSDDTLDSDANASTGITSSFVLSPDATVANIDCGMHPAAPLYRTVQGSIFQDLNRDNTWNQPGEGLFMTPTLVQLRAFPTDTLVDSMNINTGVFVFHPGFDGDFYVQITPPEGYEISTAFGDNKFDHTTGKTGAFPVTLGDTVTKDCGMMAQL